MSRNADKILKLLTWIILLVLLQSCVSTPVTKTVETLTVAPTQTHTVVPTQTNTFVVQATQPANPTRTPTVVEPTEPVERFDFFANLPSGEYLILGIHQQNALSLDEKNTIPLSGTISSARISSDGSTLIHVVEPEVYSSLQYHYQLINLRTGTYIDFPTVPDCVSVDRADLSSDGSSLIFACGGDKIVILSVDDMSEKGRITTEDLGYPSHFSIHSPLWSPNGQWIAYQLHEGGMHPDSPPDQVIVIPPNCLDHPGTCLEHAYKFSYEGQTGYNMFDWTKDSKLIMLDQEAAEFAIYDVVPRELIHRIPLPSQFTVENFSVSPDGNRIAFGQETADEREAAIYIISIHQEKIEKIYTEKYRIYINYVNLWVKTD